MLRQGGGKYCSNPCKDAVKVVPKIERTCLDCGKVFLVYPSTLKHYPCNYCCVSHAQKHSSIGWAAWHRTNPDYSNKKFPRRTYTYPVKPTPEQTAEWERILEDEGLSMDRGRLYEKRTVQIEEHENPSLYFRRRASQNF